MDPSQIEPDRHQLGPLAWCVVDASRVDLVVVEVAGEIDIASAPLLAEVVLEVGVPGLGLLVDLQDVVFIDSTGVGALVRIRKGLRGRDITHALVMGPRVKRMLEMVGLTAAFETFIDASSARHFLEHDTP